MRIISNKSYQEYSDLRFYKNHTAKDEIDYLNKRITNLTKDLEDARNLKSILEKITDYTLTGAEGFISISGGFTNREITLGENVLVYVDDIMGGKVIKQEANKCIVIDKEGNIKTGLTKQKVDKGYNYKLIRK